MPAIPFRPPVRLEPAPRAARRLSPRGAPHFFGYYDRSPYDRAGEKVLALRGGADGRMPRPGEEAAIGWIGVEDGGFRQLAATGAWNWQQGCQLQWLPPATNRVIHNDRDGEGFHAVIHELDGAVAARFPRPVADVDGPGRRATSLDFARLAAARPVIGYAGGGTGEFDPAPADDGVFLLDLESGEARLLLSLAAAVDLQEGPDFDRAAEAAGYAGRPGFEQPGAGGHRFEGATFGPGGDKVLLTHRWPRREPLELPHFQRHFWDRLVVVDVASGAATVLAPDGFYSHNCWIDDDHVLSWATISGETGLWILDAAGDSLPLAFAHGVIGADPHASFSPDRRWLLGDSYPDRRGRRHLWIASGETGLAYTLGAYASPAPFDRGPVRCDLHPRWRRDGRAVCFDSAHEGERAMYEIDVSDLVAGNVN